MNWHCKHCGNQNNGDFHTCMTCGWAYSGIGLFSPKIEPLDLNKNDMITDEWRDWKEEAEKKILIGIDGVQHIFGGFDLAQMQQGKMEDIRDQLYRAMERDVLHNEEFKQLLQDKPQQKKEPKKAELNYPALRAYRKLMEPVWQYQGCVERWMLQLDISRRSFKQFLHEQSIGVEARILLVIGMKFGYARAEDLENEFNKAVIHEEDCKEKADETAKSKH